MVLCYEVCHFIYIFKPKLTKSEKKKQLTTSSSLFDLYERKLLVKIAPVVFLTTFIFP